MEGNRRGDIPGVELPRGTEVAIKIYRLPLLQGEQTLRVQREFAIASEIDHPNLARVFDLVISPSRPFHTFMVMEYVAGRTLKEHVLEVGSLPVATVVDIGMQLFAALDELEGNDAIHRDV